MACSGAATSPRAWRFGWPGTLAGDRCRPARSAAGSSSLRPGSAQCSVRGSAGTVSWLELLVFVAAQQVATGVGFQAAGDALEGVEGLAQLADGRSQLVQALGAVVEGFPVVVEQVVDGGRGLGQRLHGLLGAAEHLLAFAAE